MYIADDSTWQATLPDGLNVPFSWISWGEYNKLFLQRGSNRWKASSLGTDNERLPAQMAPHNFCNRKSEKNQKFSETAATTPSRTMKEKGGPTCKWGSPLSSSMMDSLTQGSRCHFSMSLANLLRIRPCTWSWLSERRSRHFNGPKLPRS